MFSAQQNASLKKKTGQLAESNDKKKKILSQLSSELHFRQQIIQSDTHTPTVTYGGVESNQKLSAQEQLLACTQTRANEKQDKEKLATNTHIVPCLKLT